MRFSTTVVAAVALLVANEAVAFAPPSCHRGVFGSSTAASSSSCLFLEPLAKEYDWTAYLDEDNTGLVYYFNEKTGESLWEPPTSSFPPIRLSRKKKKLALEKQQEYYNTAKPKQEETKKGGFFATVFGKGEKEAVIEEEQPKQETPDWFDFKGSTTTTTAERARPKAADRPVLVEPDAVDIKAVEESSGGGFFSSVFGGTTEEKVDEKTAATPVNGDDTASTTKEEKKPFFLTTLKNKIAAPKETTQETKSTAATTTPTADEVQETKQKGGGFGLGKVMNVIRRSPSQAEVVPKREVEIDVGSYVLPHPAKVSWGGEDAAFVKGRTFGVFDGVSGADKLDGIPLYSKTLADELQLLVQEEDGLNTKELTSTLTEAAEFADKAATGASTAVVGSISKDGYLRVLNLGDSVCWLVRDGSVKAKTREIVHYFDCPYQLADDSPDRPYDGTKLNIEVLPGDLVLMGSDGVFDNLNDQTILQTIEEGPDKESPTMLARRIVDLSRKVSLDTEAETPYAKVAKKNGDPDYKSGKGGKVDDASLVAVRCT